MEGPNGSRGGRDAYDWSIDEVVEYLCHDSFNDWNDSESLPPRPDPEFLENAIRENDINGKVLLADVPQEALSKDLGIKSLGQRSTIIHAIRHLQKSSTKYKECDDQFVTPYPSTSASLGTPLSTYTPIIPSHNGRILPFPWTQHSPAQSAPLAQPSTPGEPPPKPVRTPTEQQAGSTAHEERPAEATKPKPLRELPTRSADHRRSETLVVAGDGKKRRKLALGPAAPVRHVQDKDWYLGREKLVAPDVFYKNSDSDNDEFSFAQTTSIPTGKRLFVKKRMQHYHRERLQSLSKHGRKAFAILPYDNGLVQDLNIPQNFTLFARDEQGNVVVTKEDSNDWPELEGVAGAFRGLLNKYPPNVDDSQEGRDVLPLYGDSDPEEGYDSDTWREIEADRQQSVQNQVLHADNVDAVIDSCIGGFIEKWHTVHRPTEERKAARLWVRAREHRTKNSDVKAASTQVAHLGRRLQKLRQTVQEGQWFKADEVRHQCQCMERTVFDQEHQKWKISILELDKCPPKPTGPAKERKTKERSHAPMDEESLDSDSSDSGDTDEDDNFIVPDDSLEDGNASRVPVGQSDSDGYSDPVMPTPRRKSVRGARKKPSLDDALPEASPSSTTPAKKAAFSTPSKQKETPRSVRGVEVVDLTMSSDGGPMDVTQPPAASNEEDDSFEVHTPPLNPAKDTNNAETPTLTSDKKTILNLTDEQERNSRESSSSARGQIHIDEVVQMDWSHFEEQQDRKRLLIKLVYGRPREEVEAIRTIFQSTSRNEWKEHMWSALKFLSLHPKEIDNLTGKQSRYMRMVMWYISFVNCERPTTKGVKRKSLKKAMDQKALDRFYPELSAVLLLGHDQRHGSETHRNVSLSTPAKSNKDKKEVLIDGSDDSLGDGDSLLEEFRRTPKAKRKRLVKQSREAMDSQRSAQRRVEMQEYQQKRLASKLESMGVENGDPERQAVSFEEPVIYLDPHIGRRVKPHQLNGIQFMWRELIKNEKQEGCLLAHTMGLGKTMQVISFLVTIANAATSSDPDVKSQVPKSLRKSRTLVLCPPSLIENWWEEFLMWIPPDAATQNHLGQLRKVQPTLAPNQRLEEISAWYENGGVLLISYDIFRTTVLNRATKNRPPPLSAKTHESVRKQLLEGPNVVVADEAHKMKNQHTALAAACVGFKTKSRIALTGSPLSNHLTEYFAMIDWISPRYLGDFVQFKAKYVEPIEAGLYSDSIPCERRQSRKRLQVLNKDLDPKVNRHDITALEDSLPPKVEFVMTVALTDVQKRAYSIYIAALRSDKGDVANTLIWHWMDNLSLLCNHPACFRDKTMQANNNPQKRQRLLSESDSETLLEPVSEVLSKDVLAELHKVFETVKETDLDSPSLSHRARILNELVEESVRVGDRILVFSHSLPTLDYIERLLIKTNKKYCRLDGKTPVGARQASTKSFNQANSGLQVYLISTRAGGLGLNIPGANRVVLFDSHFNPTWEEQAVGRTYRLGQNKPVFVYRFIAGGTFQDVTHNKAVFKTQLALGVVDKKNPIPWASKNQRDYLFPPKEVQQDDLSQLKGKDSVLDNILEREEYIRKIELTETFQREDNIKLTAEEEKDVQAELEDERMKRNNPAEWARRNVEKEKREAANRAKYSHWGNPSQPYPASQPSTVHSHPQGRLTSVQSTQPSQSASSRSYPLVPRTHTGEPQTYSGTQPTSATYSSTAPPPSRQDAAPPPSSAPPPATSGDQSHFPSNVGNGSRYPQHDSLNGNLPSTAVTFAPTAEKTNNPVNGDSAGNSDVHQVQDGQDPQNEKPSDEMTNRQQEKDQPEDADVEMTDADKSAPPPAPESEPHSA